MEVVEAFIPFMEHENWLPYSQKNLVQSYL
jgi:hypothetical protein